jgi:Polyketide cyclase / dehydrase and lipid transport
MPTVTKSLDIPAPAEKVWSVASDLSRYGEWNITHTGFPEGPPSGEQGSTFKENITIMGMPGQATWTVTERDEPTRTVWSGEGPMGITLGTKLELAPNGDSTTVSIEVSFDGGPLSGPLGATVAASAEKGALESLEKLKGLVA